MWTADEYSRWDRNLRAMVRSAGTNDPEAFADLLRLADWLNEYGLPEAYQRLQREGYSAAEIARPTGKTRQALHQRFGRKDSLSGSLDTPDS